MARTRKKVTFVFVFIAFVLAIVVFISLNPQATLPNPNGYDDFVKAGKMVTATLDSRRGLGDYRELSLDDLREFASTNAEALRIARRGLERRCLMPVTNSHDWFQVHGDEMTCVIQLARCFLVAGRLAQLEGRTNDAVNIYLDSIRFAHESARGGLILDGVLSRSSEASGIASLTSLRGSLDADQNRRIAKALEELDTRREMWGAFLRRDVRYSFRAEFRSGLSLESWRTRLSFRTRFLRTERQRGQTILDFAARAYELETGKRPQSLTDLVPTYLKAIPQDPVTRTNLAL